MAMGKGDQLNMHNNDSIQTTPLTPNMKLSKLEEIGAKDALTLTHTHLKLSIPSIKQNKEFESHDISVTDLDGDWHEKGKLTDNRISEKIGRKLSNEIMRIGGPAFEATGSFTIKQKHLSPKPWADIHELPGEINFNLIQNAQRDD